MHARGVSPWTLRDTVGSSMLVIIGSAIGGAGVALVIVATLVTPSYITAAIAFALVAMAALSIRLGLLALRKLT